VIVAVPLVRVMQVPIDEIVDVVAMRYGFMPTALAVNMGRVMAAAAPIRAPVGIRRANRNGVLIYMIRVRVVQMAVVQVIDMPIMTDRSMTATWSVHVGMVAMRGVRGHMPSYLPI
jgi:hypothetical protein